MVDKKDTSKSKGSSSREVNLGKILFIVQNEVITKPGKSFRGKGSKVYLDNKKIGTLNDPFGNVLEPYQAILLDRDELEDPTKLIGKQVVAVTKRGRKGKNKRRNRKNITK